MADVQSEEHEVLQFGQAVMTEFQVEDNFRRTFKRGHCMSDVLLVRELTQEVEAVLLDGACTGSEIVMGRALVGLGCDVRPPPHQTYPPQRSHQHTSTAPTSCCSHSHAAAPSACLGHQGA